MKRRSETSHWLYQSRVAFKKTSRRLPLNLDDDGVQDDCFVLSPFQNSTWWFLFDKNTSWSISLTTWFKVWATSASHADVSLFWCTLFHLSSVSQNGPITDTHMKCSYQAVKNSVFKNINGNIYVISCQQHRQHTAVITIRTVLQFTFVEIKRKTNYEIETMY